MKHGVIILFAFVILQISSYAQITPLKKPPPSRNCVTLCGTSTDSLTVDEILSCDKLVSVDTNYHVITFDMEISLESGITMSDRAHFSYENIIMIKQLKKGDKIIFDTIKLARKNGAVVKACWFEIPIK
jgi:hypothetical protein